MSRCPTRFCHAACSKPRLNAAVSGTPVGPLRVFPLTLNGRGHVYVRERCVYLLCQSIPTALRVEYSLPTPGCHNACPSCIWEGSLEEEVDSSGTLERPTLHRQRVVTAVQPSRWVLLPIWNFRCVPYTGEKSTKTIGLVWYGFELMGNSSVFFLVSLHPHTPLLSLKEGL